MSFDKEGDGKLPAVGHVAKLVLVHTGDTYYNMRLASSAPDVGAPNEKDNVSFVCLPLEATPLKQLWSLVRN